MPCDWCDGTGEVATEMLPPPAQPEMFDVEVRRKNGTEHYCEIIQFEIDKDCYLMVDKYHTRIVVPMSGNIIEITTKPAI